MSDDVVNVVDGSEGDCCSTGDDGTSSGADASATFWLKEATAGLGNAEVVGDLASGILTHAGGVPGVIANSSGSIGQALIKNASNDPEWTTIPSSLSLSNATPFTVGAASAGVASTASRYDHRHDLPDIVSAATVGHPSSLTFDAKGRITAGTTGTDPATLYAPLARTITTTSPLLIDGGASADLSANRTLTIANATNASAGAATAAQITLLENIAAADLLTVTNQTALFPSSRRPVAGTGVAFDTSTPGQLIISSSAVGADGLATYVVKTAANAPVNSQILASLSTGFAKVTTTTGVVSTQATILGTDLSGFTNTTIPVANSSGQLVSSAITLASNLLTHAASASGADVGALVSNTSNTASATATLEARVAGVTAAGPRLVLGVTGGTDYTLRVASSKLEILAGATTQFTINNAYTIFGQGGTTPFLTLDTGTGTRLAFGSNNSLLLTSVDATFNGRIRLNLSSVITAASSTNFGNNATVRLQGTTTINFFTKTSLLTGNLFYVFVENGLTINHNVGAPGGTDAPIIMRSGANTAVPAGTVLAFFYDLITSGGRFIEVTGYGAAGVTAHSSLTGLTSGDDHTQYALLAGRSGGQTLIGGTASGDDLILTSTSHGTLGEVRVTDNFALFGAGSFGSGTKVMSIINASLAPSSAPTGGIIHWSEGGVAKVMGTDGVAIIL